MSDPTSSALARSPSGQSLPSSEGQNLPPSGSLLSIYFADYEGVDVSPLAVAKELKAQRVRHAGVTFVRDPAAPPRIRIAFVGEPTEEQRAVVDRAMRDAFLVATRHRGVREPVRELRRLNFWSKEATAPKKLSSPSEP